MVASAEFAEFLREQLAPLGHLTLRRMFGKTGVFCDGVMLGMVTENTLYLRVDDGNRDAFKEAAAFPPLNYAKQGRTSISRSGARRSDSLTNRTSWWNGRASRWRRPAVSPRRTNEVVNDRLSRPLGFSAPAGQSDDRA
jgi:TfoX/Sxy family transcriptional regulator of competence genes